MFGEVTFAEAQAKSAIAFDSEWNDEVHEHLNRMLDWIAPGPAESMKEMDR